MDNQLTEIFGFVTGAICVWLVVRQNVWNYPVGMVNYAFFFVLFTRHRLFGDAGLQVVYFVLALHGWYLWLRGGTAHAGVRVACASRRLLAGCALFLGAGAWSLMLALRAAQGAAPLLDAFTTALSLTAQFLQNNKKIEHWYFWIAADVIYIYLYLTRGLRLTAALYAIFLAMCVAGLLEWRRALAPTVITSGA